MKSNPYEKRMQHYDDVITGRKWWSHIYMHKIWGVNDNLIAEEVLSFIPDDFSGRLLDIPVGTAVFTYEKYKKMKSAEIVGVDYSQMMLKLAEERKQEHSLNNLTLMHGDVRDLPFDDESFDCVLSLNGFHCFPDKEKAFAECYRVLKPGGLFCGSFYVSGKRLICDITAKLILNKKGLFIPPHYTLSSAKEKLTELFGTNIMTKNYNSILVFKCIK